MLHSLATEMAVSVLSPVAMIVLILQSLRVLIVPFVASLSLFSMIRSPKN